MKSPLTIRWNALPLSPGSCGSKPIVSSEWMTAFTLRELASTSTSTSTSSVAREASPASPACTWVMSPPTSIQESCGTSSDMSRTVFHAGIASVTLSVPIAIKQPLQHVEPSFALPRVERLGEVGRNHGDGHLVAQPFGQPWRSVDCYVSLGVFLKEARGDKIVYPVVCDVALDLALRLQQPERAQKAAARPRQSERACHSAQE